MASLRLHLLNLLCQNTAKRKMRRTSDPAKGRRDLDRAARFLFRKPPFLCALPDDPYLWVSVGRCHPRRVLLYFHGGGYFAGRPEQFQGMLGRLSKLSGLRVAAARYRLAPEHPLPASFEDAVRAFDRLLAKGYHPEDIALGGDSAGGGLALALLAYLLRRGQRPAALVAFSPWTDLARKGASLRTNKAADRLLPAERIDELVERITLPGQDLTDPRLSPLYADFTGAPPVQIHVAGTEILFDDARRLVQSMGQAGVEARLVVEPDAPHVWPIFDGYVPEARATLKDAAAFLTAAFTLPHSKTDDS